MKMNSKTTPYRLIANVSIEKSSARSTAKQRAKVEKAISNANKKSRKLAKANPHSRSKLKKDPGVPNLFPLKEKVLREMEQSRQNLQTERQRRRELSQQNHVDPLEMDVEDSGMARLAQLAEDRNMEFEQGDVMTDDDSFDEMEESTKKDTSRKTYNKEFKKVIEQADIVLYVLDSRDPEGTRSKETENMIRESPNGEKQLILILNKIGTHYFYNSLTSDLIPPDTLNRWLLHLRRSFPVLPFHSNTNPQFTHPNLPQKKLSLLLHNALKSRSTQVKHTLSVGVIGFPNTGKSSIINALTRRLGQGDKVTTGSEAGLTKESRQIKLDKAITLLDSPGIVFPGADTADQTALVLLNVLPSSSVLDVRPAIHEILRRLAGVGLLKELSNVYGIPEISVSEYVDSTTEFLVQVARKRGRLGRGGVPMLESAGRIVLNDWAMGKIKWWCEAPANTTSTTDEKVVVSEWAEAFDIDALLKDTDVEMKE